jgi:filamentous hemagglutinin family protein
MTANSRFKWFITLLLSLCLINGLFLYPALITFSHAASNITSDGTLGTTINQAGNLYNIDGGTIKGSNQFHSFGLFNVGTGDTASFNGPSGIINIIGRVTGKQQSVIDGLLKSTISGANLYLLNPSGVLFGRNAALDVSGSFHVSTADYLRMTDGARFYADLGKQSTLSTAPVAAFGFLSNKPAEISIQESDLEVREGKTLSIVGGDINITGGPTGGFLVAPSGRINIASVASPGEVIPIESRDAPDLQMSSFDRLGKINLLNNYSYLDVGSSSGNGTVVIRGGKLLVEGVIDASNRGNTDGAKVGIDINIKEDLVAKGGLIIADTLGTGRGGDVVIRSGSMEMKNSSIGSSTSGAGNSGNVEVNTGLLDMREGSKIGTYASSFSSGNAGNLTVTADSIFMTGAYDGLAMTSLSTETSSDSIGRGGDLRVTTGNLEVRDGALIDASTNGSGAGGNVNINAKSILVSGENWWGSPAKIVSEGWGDGNAGSVRINTQYLEVRNGLISTSSGGSGKGGDLELTADRILLTERGDLAADGDIGDGGNIWIKTGSLEMTGGAQIRSRSFSSGKGGEIEVTANSILLSGVDKLGDYPSAISSSTSSLATGNAGNIRINTQNLEVKDGAIITTETKGAGNGGKLELSAKSVLVKDGGVISASTSGSGNSGSIDVTSDNVVITGANKDTFSLISAFVLSDSSGKGGVIRITTNNLEVKDGSFISATTFGQGDAGSIFVTAKNVLLDGGSQLITGMSANSRGSGNAGDININTNTLEMRNGGQITTAAFTKGQGGSIKIKADQVALFGIKERNHATGILSQAYSSGSAGDIEVTARNLQINDGAFISSGTIGSGNAGDISLTAPWITIRNAEAPCCPAYGGSVMAVTGGSGAGGNIQLTGNQIQLINGPSISTKSWGMGNAGDISVNARNTLLMNNSSITTEATKADGGNIDVHAGYMVNLIDSKITASVGGGPQTTGGNITIDPYYVILNDSRIIANAYEGAGGNIRIIADVFLASPESIVDASSALGIDGTVDIQAAIDSISGTLVPMQGNFLSAEELFRDRCAAKIRGGKYSSFIVSGRDGLPIRPGSVLPSPIF